MMGRNMKKKILGMFVCMLLIVTAVPTVESLNDRTITSILPKSSQPYTRVEWNEKQKLRALDSAPHDLFSYSVSIDGDTALIEAYRYDIIKDWDVSVYVFTRTGTTWTQQQKLLASEAGEFGYSLSLSGDTAIIGAPYADDNGATDSGCAYVFTRTGTTWTKQQKLLASDGTAGDVFGYSVSLNGNTALIGAAGDDGNQAYSGSAYVFTRTGTTWTQQAKLLASDGWKYGGFGWSVSLSGDTALIGVPWDHDNGANSGSAYVFTRTGTSWTQQTKLLASDGAAEDIFGVSVSLSGDTVLIGADGYAFSPSGLGSAYVFIRTGTTWTQQAKFLASDGAAGDEFGWSVSLSGDTALIGACYDDDNGGASGSAYVFTRTSTTWTQQQKLISSDGGVGSRFGYSVSLDGDTALIGAYYETDYETHGSAYVFTRTGTTWTEQTKLLSLCGVDNESDLAQLEVPVPVSINLPFYQLIGKLFQRFPYAFPILRQLLG